MVESLRDVASCIHQGLSGENGNRIECIQSVSMSCSFRENSDAPSTLAPTETGADVDVTHTLGNSSPFLLSAGP
jgi:hypothetical protein